MNKVDPVILYSLSPTLQYDDTRKETCSSYKQCTAFKVHQTVI